MPLVFHSWPGETEQEMAKGAHWEPVDEPDTEDEPPSHDPIINGPRTGRNAPCPCGSGVKFKRCCLGKEGHGGC